MKRAFIVCGPESSGNKMLGAILCRSGCVGDTRDDGKGMWSVIEPATEPLVVMVQSFPSGQHWPDLKNLKWRLNNKGYVVWVLVTVRDLFCVLESQHERRLKPRPIALANYQRAYREIFKQLDTIDAAFVIVPYESIMSQPIHAVHRLLEFLELPVSNLGGPLVVNGQESPIEDGNAKHFESELPSQD